MAHANLTALYPQLIPDKVSGSTNDLDGNEGRSDTNQIQPDIFSHAGEKFDFWWRSLLNRGASQTEHPQADFCTRGRMMGSSDAGKTFLLDLDISFGFGRTCCTVTVLFLMGCNLS